MKKLKFGNRLKLLQRHASLNMSRHPSRNRSMSPAREFLEVGQPRSTGSELPDVGVHLNLIDVSRSSASDDVSCDSSASSIKSGDRNAGPIDVDTLRRHRLKVRSRDAGSRMPKIIESPSSCTHGSGWEKSLNGSHGGDMSVATAPHSNQNNLSPSFSLPFKRERSGSSIAPKSVEDPTVTPALAHTAATAHTADKAHASANAHATATPNVVEYENPQLLKYTTPSQCSSGETQESNFINGNNITEKVDRTSPSSVIYMFDSSYPVEIDPDGSMGSDFIVEKCSLAESDEPSLLLPTLSDNYAQSYTLDQYATPAGRKMINALTELPKVTSLPRDSSSLLIVNAEKPSNDTSGDQCVISPDESGGASSIKCGKASSGMENTGTARDNNGASAMVGSIATSESNDTKGSGSLSEEFLVLKKVDEKNEFKMVVALINKRSSTSPNVLSNLPSTSSDRKPMNNYELVKLPDTLIHGTNKSRVENPPDVVDTNSFADPFQGIEEDSMVLSPSPPPQPSSQETSTTVEQDFINLQEYIVSSSSSEASISISSTMSDVSDLEFIDISICDETKRLLEAHILYTEDAATNINHPARQKKSAMRVGSVFKNHLENTGCQLNQPVPLSSDLNMKRTRSLSRIRSLKSSGSTPKVDEDCISITKVPVKSSSSSNSQSLIKTSKNKKITWYDDEVNWSKPFVLRTDESFDATTISSAVSSRLKGITQYNAMDQFIGVFMNGICQFRGDVDFDISEQEEI